MIDIAQSNSLTDLAVRIKAEHQATSDALKTSVEHAIKAGELLLEAKEQLKHGQWLPWLLNHCEISERSAQLYMRIAKNRETIEAEIRNGVADLTLNQAAALLVMTSEVRKLFNFVREMEHLSCEELIQRCIAEGVAVVQSPNYDPFAGRNETEKVEWLLFIVFQSYDGIASRLGGEPQAVRDHVEWILQRPFQNVAEWLGEEGDKWRKSQQMHPVPEQFKSAWTVFLAEHRDSKFEDIERGIDALQRQFEDDRSKGLLALARRKYKARTRVAWMSRAPSTFRQQGFYPAREVEEKKSESEFFPAQGAAA
jgi:hypothetical protein